jgi:hypothetical protein
MNQKEWKKIVGYFIPILAVLIAQFFKIDDVAVVEGQLTAIVTAIFTAVAGIIALIGIAKNNDKKK